MLSVCTELEKNESRMEDVENISDPVISVYIFCVVMVGSLTITFFNTEFFYFVCNNYLIILNLKF